MDIEDLSGRFLGPYELIQLLGAGGMGAVYRGYDASLEREAAIKVLSLELASQPGYVKRFAREAKTAANLDHMNIVPVYYYNIEDGLSYIAMRLLKGGSLESRVTAADKPLSLKEIARLLEQLARALDYAHSQGVIHRDVKANNVMFSDQDSPFLVDFGIAKLMDASNSLTETGVTMGTRSHIAPEIWRGDDITPAADQYALGVTIYGVVSGRMPFDAPTPYGLMFKHLHDPPPPPQQFRPDLSETINPVLEKALAKKPHERYPSVTDFALAFKQAVDNAESKPVVVKSPRTPTPPPAGSGLDGPTTPAPPPSVPRSRRSWRIGVLILLLLILGAGLACLPSRCIASLTESAATSTDALAMILAEATGTNTSPSTMIDTVTATDTPTATPTPTATLTASPSHTSRPSATPTSSSTPTSTRTLTSTPTYTPSPTPTSTYTPTSTRTMTPTPTMSPGTTTLNGTLTPRVPVQHTFVGQAGDMVSIRLVSDDFDTYLILRTPDGQTLAENDDCATVRRSCITVTLPVAGVYTVIVDSFDRQSGGAYTLDIILTYPLTATATQTPTPTRMATQGSAATATSAYACPDGLLTVRVISNQDSINIRSGPGREYQPVGMAYGGECLAVDGQNFSGDWLHIHTIEGRSGWVLASLTDIAEDAREALPVIEE